MRKIFVFALSFALFVSLVGCGGPENDTTSNDTPQTEITKEDDKATFDASWASNEFEALLPQLPFDGWTATQESDNIYELELGGLKTETVTDADGKTIGYGEDKTAFINYVEGLADYGFSVEETGGIENYKYEWLAADANGNEIEFTCAEGYCWITITKK